MGKFKEFLEDEEKNIRKRYAENLCDKFKREELVEMMLLDYVFIMELFLRIQNAEKQTYPDDIIVKQSWLNKNIQRDLLLLENQLPLLILEELYGLSTFYKNLNNKDLKEFGKKVPLKTATKLRESGVSFEKVTNRPLVDIKFKKVKNLSWFLRLGCIPNSTYFKARLQIPELQVEDTTECVLRNLIAFEQRHYPNEPVATMSLSLTLIHTKDDVELLVEKEVIRHELGSDKEVATLVNGLCKHVTDIQDLLCKLNIINSLNSHYQRQCHNGIILWLH
ncbi:hypothetical protein K1719_024098 [Acacia pycnantha]|nr:hypothetical protein K1719_024098 [Acacia pycnantha]